MAKTYKAEGRQIAYILRGLFIIGGLALYFNIPGLHWSLLIIIILGCYADHNPVRVMPVRELVAAKRNHDCILSLLITTSDLTAPAKKEAEQFKVDYWHGSLLEQKLNNWGKWQPSKEPRSVAKRDSAARAEIAKAKREVAATNITSCKCGAPMVRRKSKQGAEFWGCSHYPKCRNTRAM